MMDSLDERSRRAREAWLTRWASQLRQLKALEAEFGEQWVEEHRGEFSDRFLPRRTEEELREKIEEQKQRNREWRQKQKEGPSTEKLLEQALQGGIAD